MMKQLKSTKPKDAGLTFKMTLKKGEHLLIVGGSEKCCDATTAWKFRVNGAEWMDYTTANLDKPTYNKSYTEKEDDEEDEFTIKKLPLAESTIMWKTVGFSQNAVNNFDELQSEMTEKSGKGYCTKMLNHMVGKSNKRVCKGSAKNIGYYFRTTFPVATDEVNYYFRTPTDFGRGGVVVLDGKVIKQVKTDIWQGGKSTKLNFNATLDKGNHLLEYWGAEGCCDGTFSWSFRTEQTKWMQYSTKNFNNIGLAK
jgi:hypothetical protein